MADIKREAKTDDDVTLPDELRARARAYSAMAVAHSTVSYSQRRAFETSAVRHLNNFVKACLLDACARTCVAIRRRSQSHDDGFILDGLRVADIAAGRGQDQAKFMYAARDAGTAIREYYALDLSSEDTVSARLMAAKYIQPSARVLSIVCGDMGTHFAHVPDDSIDILSCQLALHYLFDDVRHLQTFFSEARRVLCATGIMVVSYADGRSIVRRARNALSIVTGADADADADVAEAVVTVSSRYYTFSVPERFLAHAIAGPYGLRYTFTLPGSVDAVPEYLAHEGCIIKHAQEYGLHAGTSMYFDEAALRFVGIPRLRSVSEKMGGCWYEVDEPLDTAKIYRFNIFSKNVDVLRLWDAEVTQETLGLAGRLNATSHATR